MYIFLQYTWTSFFSDIFHIQIYEKYLRSSDNVTNTLFAEKNYFFPYSKKKKKKKENRIWSEFFARS